MTTHSGSCLCGAVRFTAEGVNTAHSACHCGMCRRWGGGGPFFGVRTTSVTFEGDDSITRYASSPWAERGFCSKCGTHLFYFLVPAAKYMMSAGIFADTAAFRLASEIFVDHKPDGYAFAGDHPRLTEAETLAKFAPKT
ncbi:MAG: GFA family protein [Polyangiaceae bacterium]